MSALLNDFIIHINWLYLVKQYASSLVRLDTLQVDQASVCCTSLDQVELSDDKNRSDSSEINEIIRSFYDLHHSFFEDIYFCLH